MAEEADSTGTRCAGVAVLHGDDDWPVELLRLLHHGKGGSRSYLWKNFDTVFNATPEWRPTLVAVTAATFSRSNNTLRRISVTIQIPRRISYHSEAS